MSHSRSRRRPALRSGFSLIVTITILVLLAMVAVGMLTLSTLQIRSSRQGDAQAEAKANARLALMLAIGELQKTMGPDKRICAPAGILDSNIDSAEVQGVEHQYLTGVWEARDEELGETPDYDREKPFVQWLVSHNDRDELERLQFPDSGNFEEEARLVDKSDEPGSRAVFAGKVSMDRGAYAWWVGDENSKVRVNPRDLIDREGNSRGADYLASFASPGAHGLQALPQFEDFPTNSEESDRMISHGTTEFILPETVTADTLFHDVTPYSESLLTNVTKGSLREDLSLFLARADVDWLSPWGAAEGVRRQPSGPLGPNGKIALSPPNEYDVLGWKSLHHWTHLHEALSRRWQLDAMNGSTARIDPITNPGWNSGVSLPTPVVVRIQLLLSYGLKRGGSANQWRLYMYSYPAVTLWNPYNIPMNVPEYSVFLHTLPLEHKIFVNNVQRATYNWQWGQGNMVFRLTAPVTLAPGEGKILTYQTTDNHFKGHNMVARLMPYTPRRPGREFDIGTITASAADRISIQTRAARWETSGTSYGGQNFQTTFGYRCEAKNRHRGHPPRFRQQMFSGQVCWRREGRNPSASFLSERNFPTQTVGSALNAPSPFVHLDIRLKTLDERDLPNKLWSQCIPSLPFAAATSTSKHRSYSGIDDVTTFFAHPYTVTFEQKTAPEGLFQRVPFFGTSNTPDGQSFITSREIPIAPLTSIAQLQGLPQHPMEGLNWSGYYFQNNAIGNSFANPGLPSDQIKKRSFPFYLGEYFAWQGGDLTGRLYPNNTHFNVADYNINFAPASIIDRSYAANHLLWDDYYFSSITEQLGLTWRYYGERRPLDDVVRDFFTGEKQLPNLALQPHVGSGLGVDDVLKDLVGRRGAPTEDAYLKAATHLKVNGGFNINSTSVPAWTAVLGSAHRKRAVIFDASANRGEPRPQDAANFVVSRFTMPNGPAADDSAGDWDLRWRGYRELTAEQIQELARAVVRQVKERGPFRSLGEFVNRRLSDSTDERSLYGALQAALEDSSVSINDPYRSLEITKSDIRGTAYDFEEAALGSRYQGAPGYVTQADLLMTLGPVMQARSDTFVVRAYGESRTPDGRTVRARAWCEAVVQRQPEYLDSEDLPEVAWEDLRSKENEEFGRRFTIKAFRWLSESDIDKEV